MKFTNTGYCIDPDRQKLVFKVQTYPDGAKPGDPPEKELEVTPEQFIALEMWAIADALLPIGELARSALDLIDDPESGQRIVQRIFNFATKFSSIGADAFTAAANEGDDVAVSATPMTPEEVEKMAEEGAGG